MNEADSESDWKERKHELGILRCTSVHTPWKCIHGALFTFSFTFIQSISPSFIKYDSWYSIHSFIEDNYFSFIHSIQLNWLWIQVCFKCLFFSIKKISFQSYFGSGECFFLFKKRVWFILDQILLDQFLEQRIKRRFGYQIKWLFDKQKCREFFFGKQKFYLSMNFDCWPRNFPKIDNRKRKNIVSENFPPKKNDRIFLSSSLVLVEWMIKSLAIITIMVIWGLFSTDQKKL